MTNFGVVAIGRNEGERLRECLESVKGLNCGKVYVDSGSNDGSVGLARLLGIRVLELASDVPFTAARARNEGFGYLLNEHPETSYVMFVDGDCSVLSNWPDQAVSFLKDNPRAAIVCGRRAERFPDHSIYNAVCDIEWNTPVGQTNSCGGDSVARVAAFKEVGGFNSTVPAGEEPELCKRICNAGWEVHRLGHEMTIHDAAIFRFGDWWQRQIRTGYGALNVEARFRIGQYRRMLISAWMWCLGWILGAGILVGLLISDPTAWTWGANLFWVLLPVLQVVRLSVWRLRVGDSFRVALGYGGLTMISKWGQVWGQIRYLADRLYRRPAQLIEYK